MVNNGHGRLRGPLELSILTLSQKVAPPVDDPSPESVIHTLSVAPSGEILPLMVT